MRIFAGVFKYDICIGKGGKQNDKKEKKELFSKYGEYKYQTNTSQ